MTLRAWSAGIGAALRTPSWLEGPRLLALTQRGERHQSHRRFDPASADAAHLALRALARLPGGHWRATCLYRSTAEVLLRRAAGEDALLQLGVRREGEEVGAHAWVESGGVPVGRDAEHASRYAVLGGDGVVTSRLTSDGQLTIAAPAGLLGEWLPGSARPSVIGAAHLEITPRPGGRSPPVAAPTLTLLDVAAWVDGAGATFRSSDGRLDGTLDLARRRGMLGVTPGAHAEPLLTVATALLLGRLGRALVHAAAVVAPGGRAWLIVGDTHSGKSTTVATLAAAGWGWLADDQVIAAHGAAGVTIEGWPRTPNLDRGYATGTITGERIPARDALPTPTLGPLPLGGVLISRIEADAPTRLEGATSADAFVMLVRQAPWLLADVVITEQVRDLLASASASRVGTLVLGRDSYRRPDRLLRVLGPLIE